ncbi:MAG: hypothetical protein NZ602_06120, partial [Thermoguttaceae bacterium]|nr:hypothetical protein [Thermoguttaceae bacterium]
MAWLKSLPLVVWEAESLADLFLLDPRRGLAVIHKLEFTRSDITLGKIGKLVEQHRMDQIENIGKPFSETKDL